MKWSADFVSYEFLHTNKCYELDMFVNSNKRNKINGNIIYFIVFW